MPSIEEVKTICVSMLRDAPTAVPLIIGPPGMGKSDAAIQIAKALGCSDDRTLVVHINNHDVVDFTGVPSVVDGVTKFNPTDMFYRFREGTGPGVIVLEELPQSSVQHQTWAAGFMLERQTPTFKLDPEVRIIATGNRVEDKAGAKQLLSHLNDRMYRFSVETSLDDWCAWAIEHDIDPIGIAFLRLRPELLNDFDASRTSNPTQRSWTKVFTEVPTTLPAHLYLHACEAKVGEGAAAEWTAARDLMHKMPNVDAVRANPDNAEVPTEPAVLFAVSTSMATTTTPDLFATDMQYVNRMPKEFQMVYMTDAIRKHAELKMTKAFTDWAIANQNIFIGGN